MFKNTLLAIMICTSIFSNHLLAARGDEANNGAGLAERNLTFALSKLDYFISLCLEAENCLVSNAERMLLQKIAFDLPRERETAPLLIFAAQEDGPGGFVIDGDIKIAMTGSEVGSPIWVNKKLIYSKKFGPISFNRSVSLLVHELGHHQKEYDHQVLDILGDKVAAFISGQTQTYPLDMDRSGNQLLVINYLLPEVAPTVLLSFNKGNYDLTERFFNMAPCGNPIIALNHLAWTPLSMIKGHKKVLNGYYFVKCHVEDEWMFKPFTFEFDSSMSNEVGSLLNKNKFKISLNESSEWVTFQ